MHKNNSTERYHICIIYLYPEELTSTAPAPARFPPLETSLRKKEESELTIVPWSDDEREATPVSVDGGARPCRRLFIAASHSLYRCRPPTSRSATVRASFWFRILAARTSLRRASSPSLADLAAASRIRPGSLTVPLLDALPGVQRYVCRLGKSGKLLGICCFRLRSACPLSSGPSRGRAEEERLAVRRVVS